MSDRAISWLVLWFGENAGYTPAPSDDYHAAEALDSLGIVGLVLDVEEHFGFEFGHRDFQDRRFRTLAGLAEMIAERAGE